VDRGAAYQIENFALHDKVMKRVHDLLNRGGPIPPVHIQDVDVRRTQHLERRLNGEEQRFCMISTVVHFVSDIFLATLEVHCILAIISYQ
jgi:hypothetical protein